MPRVTMWILTICSVLLALSTNAAGWKYPMEIKINPPEVDPTPDDNLSFAGLFNKVRTEIKSIVSAIKTSVISGEKELKKEAKYFVKPLVENSITEIRNDIKSLTEGLYGAVKDYFNDVRNIDSALSEIIRDGIRNITDFEPNKFVKEFERIIEDKEAKLTVLLTCLNLTIDTSLLNETLQALYNYPQSKKDLEELLMKNLENLIYDQYLQLSDKLRDEVTVEIRKLVKNLQNYVDKNSKGQANTGAGMGNLIEMETEKILEDAITEIINDVFDKENELNKKRLDKVIYVGKDIVIAVDEK